MPCPSSPLPSFAVGGAVFSGHISPDYVYLRFLNAMDQMAMINERIAAKAADAAKMQELAAERWGRGHGPDDQRRPWQAADWAREP